MQTIVIQLSVSTAGSTPLETLAANFIADVKENGYTVARAICQTPPSDLTAQANTIAAARAAARAQAQAQPQQNPEP